MPFVSPSFKAKAFNCPYCEAFSQMHWTHLATGGAFQGFTPIHRSTCTNCNKEAFWLQDEYIYLDGSQAGGKMLSPANSVAPMPHVDMPKAIQPDFEEARLIVGYSPRAAAALLRLVIQKLCIELGEPGKNINNDIASLVKKGLPVEIQQALDIVRVVGNNAVHPGELSKDDVSDVATGLFELVNQIVEDRIARPKKLQAMFDKLPAGAREAIQKRDNG